MLSKMELAKYISYHRHCTELDLSWRSLTDIDDVISCIIKYMPAIHKLNLHHNNELDLRENTHLDIDNMITVLRQMPHLRILHVDCLPSLEKEDEIAISLRQLEKFNELVLTSPVEKTKATPQLTFPNSVNEEDIHRVKKCEEEQQQQQQQQQEQEEEELTRLLFTPESSKLANQAHELEELYSELTEEGSFHSVDNDNFVDNNNSSDNTDTEKNVFLVTDNPEDVADDKLCNTEKPHISVLHSKEIFKARQLESDMYKEKFERMKKEVQAAVEDINILVNKVYSMRTYDNNNDNKEDTNTNHDNVDRQNCTINLESKRECEDDDNFEKLINEIKLMQNKNAESTPGHKIETVTRERRCKLNENGKSSSKDENFPLTTIMDKNQAILFSHHRNNSNDCNNTVDINTETNNKNVLSPLAILTKNLCNNISASREEEMGEHEKTTYKENTVSEEDTNRFVQISISQNCRNNKKDKK